MFPNGGSTKLKVGKACIRQPQDKSDASKGSGGCGRRKVWRYSKDCLVSFISMREHINSQSLANTPSTYSCITGLTLLLFTMRIISYAHTNLYMPVMHSFTDWCGDKGIIRPCGPSKSMSIWSFNAVVCSFSAQGDQQQRFKNEGWFWVTAKSRPSSSKNILRQISPGGQDLGVWGDCRKRWGVIP